MPSSRRGQRFSRFFFRRPSAQFPIASYSVGVIARIDYRHQRIRDRLAAEIGRIDKDAPWRVALASPSPYPVAMSSLGFQCVYRILQSLPGVACERVFLPDPDLTSHAHEAPVSYERLRPVTEFQLVALSVAYELELAGVVRILSSGGLPVLSRERNERHPLVLAGGPLTFANVAPLVPFVDALVLGEAEGVLERVVETLRSAPEKSHALLRLRGLPSVWVPALDSAVPQQLARAADCRLPATSVICTPYTELASMFLVEAERGCSRGCTYCLMRRPQSGGMRVVPPERILAAIPAEARRVGLVGAAVSDHPALVTLVEELAQRGCEVGLSSLRPDRISSALLLGLARAGGRTLTTALDGASERLRACLARPLDDSRLVQVAELARAHGFDRVKLYLMLGVPGETDADLDDCARLLHELARCIPTALAISPFCAKAGTPLAGAPYAGVATLQARLNRLLRALRGRVRVRATSVKWAWVEHVLAAGSETEGRAVARAVAAGGSFSDYRACFQELGHSP